MVAFRLRGVRVAVAVVIALGLCTSMRAQGPVDYVDPTIGNVGILLEPTRPAVYLPNSMIRLYPMRDDALDDHIESFPLTISSHRQPELFSMMPGETGAPAVYDQEITMPYYYATRFDESLIRTEFSPPTWCGYFRFTFPGGKAAGCMRIDSPGRCIWSRMARSAARRWWMGCRRMSTASRASRWRSRRKPSKERARDASGQRCEGA